MTNLPSLRLFEYIFFNVFGTLKYSFIWIQNRNILYQTDNTIIRQEPLNFKATLMYTSL